MKQIRGAFRTDGETIDTAIDLLSDPAAVGVSGFGAASASLADSSMSASEAMNGTSGAGGNTGVYKFVQASGNPMIDGLLSGVSWKFNNFSVSYPTTGASYGLTYADGKQATFSPFTEAQRLAADFALSLISDYVPVTFNSGSPSTANIRFGNFQGAQTHAYYPDGFASMGDVWYGTGNGDQFTADIGGFAYATIFHEIGHALGLKHGQDVGMTGGGTVRTGDGLTIPNFAPLPAAFDNWNYALMSYRSYQGAGTDFIRGHLDSNNPVTYMMADIAALQHMYGANFSGFSSTDTLYQWGANGDKFVDGGLFLPGAADGKVFETIWDGGGTDTYDTSNFSGNQIIDLRPGMFSTFDSAKLADLDRFAPGRVSALGNIANALQFRGDARSLIENAVTGNGNDRLTGNAADNDLRGMGGNDALSGGDGDDLLSGGAGNDVLDGGAGGDGMSGGTGDDLFVFRFGGGADYITDFSAGAGTPDRIDVTALGMRLGAMMARASEGDLFGTETTSFDFGNGQTLLLVGVDREDLTRDDFFYHNFEASWLELNAFGRGAGAGGWASDDAFPRHLADVTGDGRDDIVGFGGGGVFVSLNDGNGNFSAHTVRLGQFGNSPSFGGWTSDNIYHRELGDVTGDGRADIVGFGGGGVFVSVNDGNGNFAAHTVTLAEFGHAPGFGGWSSQDRYPRQLADVNGDNLDDIVGFGEAGVYVSLATGGGNFAPHVLRHGQFGAGAGAGGWSSDNRYHREFADLNGDNMEDIIGFGEAGVYVSLATGGGNFASHVFTPGQFGAGPGAGSWISQDRYPRHLADVDGDGSADIVGFGDAGLYVAHGNGNGRFDAATFDFAAFGAGAGGWSSDDAYARHLGYVNNDGAADIVGFGEAGVFVSSSTGFLLA